MKLIKSEKGAFDIADPILWGIAILMLYIGMQIVIPMMSNLATATANMTNSGLFMTLVYITPILIIGLMFYGFTRRAQNPGQGLQ